MKKLTYGKCKGSISVFCIMITFSLLVLFTSMYDIIRLYYAVSVYSGDYAAVTLALLNDCKDDADRRIGFSFVADSEESLVTRMESLFQKYHEDEEVLGVTLVTLPYVSGVYLTESENLAYMPVKNYCVYRKREWDYRSLEDTLSSFDAAALTLKANSAEVMRIADVAMSSAEADYWPKELRQGILAYWLCELPAYGSIPMGRFQNRFSSDLMRWCVDGRMTNRSFAPNNCSVSFGETISNTVWDSIYYLPEHPLFLWYDCDSYSLVEDWYSRINDLILYADDCMTCATDERAGISGLRAEYEYLMYGNASDRENIAKACEQITTVRLVYNLMSIATDVNLRMMIHAEPGESAEAAMVRWAITESIYDVKTMLGGGSVRIIKSAGDFRTTPETALADVHAGTEKSGVGYQQYLWELTYYSAMSGQIVCTETLYGRFLDWIWFGTGINPDTTPFAAVMAIHCEVEYEPVSLAGYWLNVTDIGCMNYSIGLED